MLKSPIARAAAILALVLGVGVGVGVAMVTGGARGVSNAPATTAPLAEPAPSTTAPAAVSATATVAPAGVAAPSPTIAVVANAPSPAASVAASPPTMAIAAASSPVARAAAGTASPVANGSPPTVARAPGGSPTTGGAPVAQAKPTGDLPTVRPGTNSIRVATLQHLLRHHGASIDVDAEFGPATEAAVRAFQQRRGLPADGTAGPPTWSALFVTVKRGDRGEAVAGVQSRLGWDGFLGEIDGTPEIEGYFGDGTDRAVRACQEANGLPADGIVGPQTWAALVATE